MSTNPATSTPPVLSSAPPPIWKLAAGAASLLALIVVGVLSLASLRGLHETAFSVRVVDETGAPVPYLTVRAVLDQERRGRTGNLFLEEKTDANGVVSFRGQSKGKWTYSIDVPEFEPVQSTVVMATMHSNGRWQPWDQRHEVVARRKAGARPR